MELDAEEQLSLWKRQNSPLYDEYLTSNFKLRNDPRVTKLENGYAAPVSTNCRSSSTC